MLVEKLSFQLLISNPRSNEPIVLVLNRDLAGNASNLPGTIYTVDAIFTRLDLPQKHNFNIETSRNDLKLN